MIAARPTRTFLVSLLILSTAGGCATSQHASPSAEVPVAETLSRLIAEADTDQDQKISVRDEVQAFRLDEGHTIRGHYALSVLLQELSLARERGEATTRLETSTLEENPVDRTSRLIRELYWDGLTRRIDEKGLKAALEDSKTKTKSGRRYLYVPASDRLALGYYEGIRNRSKDFEIRKVPARLTKSYVQSLDGAHGLLSLEVARDGSGKPAAKPFVVPGGRFNEMYGWDSYFIVRGLLLDSKLELARAMVDNHGYQIERYGKILNANRTYYLTRTQPPFFAAMLRAVHEAMPKKDPAWLKRNLERAVREHRTVWAAAPRHVGHFELARYFDEGQGPGPEVEPGGYDALVAPLARDKGETPSEFLQAYRPGHDARADSLFWHDRTVRETGHDTTYRFDMRAGDFLTVDLNSLLYRYETDIAELIEKEFGGKLSTAQGMETAADWRARAARRREAIQRWLWNAQEGFFFDYDLGRSRQSRYVSATAFYPLWAGVATPEQARSVMAVARRELERKGGLAAGSEASRGPISLPDRPQRQWDYPYGWPPHQILAWEGLIRMGLGEDAQRLIYRWLHMMSVNARDYNGMVTEKYDVAAASHEAFAEYGNVGSKFAYITREGFGWTNASYQIGLSLLDSKHRERLRRFEAP